MSIQQLPITEQELTATLKRYGVTEAAVFGSFARGDATPESDLDLLVTYRQGVNLLNVLALQNELERLLGRNVDLVSKKYLSKRLSQRIAKDITPLASV